MKPVVYMHIGAAALLLSLAVGAFSWGMFLTRRGAREPHPRTIALWNHVVVTLQTAVFATGGLGLWLYLAPGANHPADPLHARVYGPFMVVVIVAAWGFRTDEGRWNVRVMAIAGLFIALLGVRAITTG